jgi:uncharacterized membrane protein YvbJ
MTLNPMKTHQKLNQCVICHVCGTDFQNQKSQNSLQMFHNLSLKWLSNIVAWTLFITILLLLDLTTFIGFG